MKRQRNDDNLDALVRPSPEDSERCIAIRKRSKRGELSSPKEHAFCRKMFGKFPAWYEQTEERVFNETVPFGSQARYMEQRKADLAAMDAYTANDKAHYPKRG